MTARPRHNRPPAPALKRNAVILQRCWWISSARPRSRTRLDPDDMREVILAYQNIAHGKSSGSLMDTGSPVAQEAGAAFHCFQLDWRPHEVLIRRASPHWRGNT
jgi:hypothetical protein